MKKNQIFYWILLNNFFANVINNLLWSALTFWLFLETKSIVAASFLGGIFAILQFVGGFIFGPLVDKYSKKSMMILSSGISLVAYLLAYGLFVNLKFASAADPFLWLFIILMMMGVTGNTLRLIAQSTTVSLLFTKNHDKKNGLIGLGQGLSFILSSVLGGLVLGFWSLQGLLLFSCGLTVLIALHALWIPWKEKKISHNVPAQIFQNFRQNYALIATITGLGTLIVYNMFNNFLGGIYMALMDSYGLSIVSVEWWGILWGIASGFSLLGAAYVHKKGLGKNPLRLMFLLNIFTWSSCIIFPLKISAILLFMAMISWMLCHPIVEACEQTVLQKVVPLEFQGRVFGLAQSLENLASPMTAFLIGPITQYLVVPWLESERGFAWLGSWFGTGNARGIALVFILSGFLGAMATFIAWKSKGAKALMEKS